MKSGAAAEPLPSVVAEDADDPLPVDRFASHLPGIDFVAQDVELKLAIVHHILGANCPRRAVGIGDDEGRRDLDIVLTPVLALIASAV